MDHSALVCRCTLLTHPRTRLSFQPFFPLLRGARVDETTPKCAHPAVGMKLVLRAPLLVMSAETVYGASATLVDTLLGAHGKGPCTYDVREILGILDTPPPPCPHFTQPISTICLQN